VSSQPDSRESRGPQVARFCIGGALSLVTVWLAARGVDWSAFIDNLRRVNTLWLSTAVMCLLAGYCAIAFRWRSLLRETCSLTLTTAFEFTMIGYLAGLVLPARLGDLAKVVLVARHTSASSSRVLGSVVLERLSDMVMLLLLAAAFSLTASIPPMFKNALLALAVITAIVIVFLTAGVEHWRYLVDPPLRLLPEQMARSIEMNFLQVSNGLRALRQPRQLIAVLMQTIGCWIWSALAMTAFIWACGLQLPWYAGLFILVLTNLGGILPVSPGSIGVYHFLAVTAVTIWAPDTTAALSFAVVTHAVSMLVVVAAGAVSLARRGLSIDTLRAQLAVGGASAKS
jgi:uncharacterized protein (TIRG00374 family)